MSRKLVSARSIQTAVMGGSFDPFHLGHLNSLLTVKENFQIDHILLTPSFKNPLEKKGENSSPFHRLEMLRRVAKEYPFMEVDDQEILRKGTSYTYKTINELSKKRKNEKLFFIMGLDQFYIFDQWKNVESILQKASLIVTSRPGQFFPKSLSNFPESLKKYIHKRKPQEVQLKFLKGTSKKEVFSNIYFCSLKDMDISSSDIKERLKEKKEISHLIPKEINNYIKENKLYMEQEESSDQTKTLIDFVVKGLESKKAYDIELYNLKSKPMPFSFGLIAVADNTRQTKAIAKHLKREIKKRFDINPLNEEGIDSARWIVLDYNDLLIHIFYDYTKKFYKLDDLWKSSLVDKI